MMNKEELQKELLNNNIKDLSTSAINKSRGLKIRTQLKELCNRNDFKLIDAELSASCLSIYIRTSKYYNKYINFEFNLCNILTCLDNIKVCMTEGLSLYNIKPIVVSWEDLETIMQHFYKTCTLKNPKSLNKFDKNDTILYKKGSFFYMGVIKNIIKNDADLYEYEIYNDIDSTTIMVKESEIYPIENIKSFVVLKKSVDPRIDVSPCRRLAATIIDYVYNSKENYYTIEDGLTRKIEQGVE